MEIGNKVFMSYNVASVYDASQPLASLQSVVNTVLSEVGCPQNTQKSKGYLPLNSLKCSSQ